jgi:hypothetical protein
MMTRYLRQRDTYSCGPIAILNALKWAGASKTGKSIRTLRKDAKCNYPDGTYSVDFNRALRKKGKRFFSTKWVASSLTKVVAQLRAGNAVLLSFTLSDWYRLDGDRAAHYALLLPTSKNEKKFRVVNLWRSETVCVIQRRKLREMLKRRKSGSGWYPRVWYLKKH